MDIPLRFSKNILRELDELVANGEPVLSSERGDLFLSESLSLGAIRLKVDIPKYFGFIASLAEEVWPRPIYLMPVEGRSFEIVVNGRVMVENNSTFINGKKLVLL